MALTYTNPVWSGYFADPHAIRVGGEYYAYATGERAADGRYFPVLRSPDLIHWEPLGGALEPVPGIEIGDYWAPEVTESGGKFYMYFSAQTPDDWNTHRLRVAVADRPEGPFRPDPDPLMPDEGFTIDAHPFQDPKDGRWYLFFAKDFFDARAGTAIAAAPLSGDLRAVAGPVTPILRPSADWQVHAYNRENYGKVWDAWHTVEGPFTVWREGRYWMFYSGGAWHQPGYGVGVAVADSVLGPYTEPVAGPVVIQGVEGHVLGPGHNSMVTGPDGRDYLIYHAWDQAMTARRLCIDPIEWTPDGPRCLGPTWTPQAIG